MVGLGKGKGFCIDFIVIVTNVIIVIFNLGLNKDINMML